jgi:Glycosyl transferase family 2
MSYVASRKAATPLAVERPFFGQVVRQFIKLHENQLATALQEQARSGGSLGAILTRSGHIVRDDITEVLRIQARWVATGLESQVQLPLLCFLSLCLPAYNEQDNIGDTLDAACAILPEFVDRFEVVVVDDGSRDNTAAIVTEYASREPRVRLVQHASNKGYGAAVTTGLRAARGDLVSFNDSDGQFNFLDFAKALALLDGADIVVGYRFARADHWRRRFNAWGWNMLVRLFLGVKIRDLDCAFKLFRRPVIDGLTLTATGAAINAEIMVQCVHRGLVIRETPVSHYPRYQGAPTGAAFKVILRAFLELPGLWKHRKNLALPEPSSPKIPATQIPTSPRSEQEIAATPNAPALSDAPR